MLRDLLILLKTTEKELNYKTIKKEQKFWEIDIFNLVWKAITRTNFE